MSLFLSPARWRWVCLLAALPYIVSCVSFQDKTAAQSTPAHSSPAAASAPAAGASAPTAVAYRLEVDAPDALRKLLIAHLDLARFQAAPKTEGITQAELSRLAAAAPAQARSLLETEGYFNATASVSQSATPEGKPKVTVTVTPGVRTTVQTLDVTVEGDLQATAQAGDASATALLKQLQERWTLKPGRAFRQAEWSSNKNAATVLLRAEGYQSATWTRTDVHVDARNQTAAIEGVIHSGPLYRLGTLRIEGINRFNEKAIRRLAGFGPGSPYRQQQLLDYQERLGKIGLFESVTVDVEADPAHSDANPVVVRVREKALQQATYGIGYSDDTGGRITLEHWHRRPFGWNGQVQNKFEVGRDKRSWEGEMISDPTGNRYRNLVGASIERLDAEGEVTLSKRVRLGRSLDGERIERMSYVEFLSSNLTKLNVDQSSQAVSVNYNWIWRDVDNVLAPTRGLTSSIQTAGGYARSSFADSGPFGRFYNRNTLYLPLGRGWLSQARIEFGQVFAADEVGIPDPLLFRAGGENSVRGYNYRTLGLLVGDKVFGGRKLLTASVEVAHPFSARHPDWLWAAFIDAGNASNQWSELSAAVGYGIGLRYRSPLGPIRFDWAYARELHHMQFHLSVGVAF